MLRMWIRYPSPPVAVTNKRQWHHGPCVEWSDISVTFIFRKSLLTSKVYTVFKIITIFFNQWWSKREALVEEYMYGPGGSTLPSQWRFPHSHMMYVITLKWSKYWKKGTTSREEYRGKCRGSIGMPLQVHSPQEVVPSFTYSALSL